MKQIKLTFTIILAIFLQTNISFSQGIAVNDDGTDADPSAILDIKSNAGNQGILLPRLTELQKNGITTPAASLLVYQTDGTKGFYYYNGTSWQLLGQDIKKYADVASAEAAGGNDNDLCYVISNETFYRYESSAAIYTDDNKYILSTADGLDSRWLGISGKYNLFDNSLEPITHLDATSGSAVITELNKIYYIMADTTTTTITIPDATLAKEGFYLRLYKCSGDGILNIQTTGGQNIDGDNPAQIVSIGKGFFIKSDSGTEWLKIQDSRRYIPIVITTSVDYTATDNWNFDYLLVNTDAGDVNVTLPADISDFPEGSSRMFFNTGSNRLFGIPNGHTIDGSTETRVIAPGGYVELQKINGLIRIVREKNLTIKKTPTDIANLECWLDASQLSGTDGTAIPSWTDLANGHIFSALSGEEPVLKTGIQNNKNVVRFDGINDVMSAGDIELHNNLQGLTIIAVVKPADTKRMAILSKYLTSPDNREFAFGNSNNFLFEDLTWGSYTYTNMSMNLDDYQIAEFVWTPGKPFELYINGVLVATANNPVTDISDGTANLKLGCGDYTNVGFWDGDFAEIMIYSNAVSETERKALRDNLSVKWDIDPIVIANGGAKYWQRDGNTNTISPDVANDNLDIGTGTFTGGTINATQLLNAPVLSAPPTSPQIGSIYFDTTDSKLKVWTGIAWELLN
ncbi:MAG: LamG domain-containing protein [Bacteroidales bacterium]|nr:LamG domain-containing protein [Bacteroidales bacterium]